jgi:hypothetical protein
MALSELWRFDAPPQARLKAGDVMGSGEILTGFSWCFVRLSNHYNKTSWL